MPKYLKCNPAADYGFRDLIFQVMTEVGRPMGSADVWAYALLHGLDAKLWPNGCTAKTPHATLYARMSEEAQKPNGFITRMPARKGFMYALVPGRTPKSRRSLNTHSANRYVYAISDPITRVPLYIGLGQGDRKDVHCAGKSHNVRLTAAIAELRSKGREPLVEVMFDKLTFAQARARETATITLLGRRGFDLTGVLFNIKS